MGESRKFIQGNLVGKLEGMRPLGNPGLDGRIILRLISRKWNVEA
jgi:hypothetical protein